MSRGIGGQLSPWVDQRAEQELHPQRVDPPAAGWSGPDQAGWNEMNSTAMELGPIEYMMISFASDIPTGRIVAELAKLIEAKLIRVVDLAFVTKTSTGQVSRLEPDILHVIPVVEGGLGRLIGDRDVQYVAQSLGVGSSCVVLIWEDLWATPLIDSVRRSHGAVVEGMRIPQEVMETAYPSFAPVAS